MPDPIATPAPAPAAAPTPAPAAPAAASTAAAPAKPSLEDSLASLDEQTRAFVLGEVRDARKEAEGLRGRLKEAEPKLKEYDAWAAASKTKEEQLQEQLAREQAARVDWQTRAVSSQVLALAATDFADPSDALTVIKPEDYLGAGGEIDEARLKADLAAALERKPHWRKPQADTGPAVPRTPVPNPAQGAGANGAAPASPREQFGALMQGLIKGP